MYFGASHISDETKSKVLGGSNRQSIINRINNSINMLMNESFAFLNRKPLLMYLKEVDNKPYCSINDAPNGNLICTIRGIFKERDIDGVYITYKEYKFEFKN